MNLLSVENISKRFGERLLFEELSFGIDQGQKIALVAKNGEGKTTLLELLSSNVLPDTGRVVWRNDTRISYLKQNEKFPEQASIQDVFLSANNNYAEAFIAYDQAMANPSDQNFLDQAMARMEELDAWNYQAKIEKLLQVFNLGDLPKDHLVSNLSGGQKKRLSLIKLILEEPEVYILDEPTNHLDISMIEWLEDYLSDEKISLLVVSHDRYFLNRVCNQIIELDFGKAYKYNGNYAFFLEKKAERAEIQASETHKAKNLYKKELEWMRRMPKARGTKSKARIEDFKDISKKAKTRNVEDTLHLDIKSERLGSKILELHHVKKNYGDIKILNDFSYVFKQGEKIGIAGKNGVGKSSFLNLLLELEQPDSGKIIRGETVRFGYYAQSGINIEENKRIIEVVSDIAEVIPLAKGRKITASQLLERFLFPPKQQYTQVSKLSGGERKRLYLLTVLMANPNFLILDEPTNDLDIKTIGILEDFLQDFTGCLLIVSHDRAFMDHLADHIFHFKGDGEVKDYNGSYSDLIQKEKVEANQATKLKSKKEIPTKAAEKAEADKLNYTERKEYNKLEKEIEKLEDKKQELLQKMGSGISDSEILMEISNEVTQLERSLDEKSNRWLELADRA